MLSVAQSLLLPMAWKLDKSTMRVSHSPSILLQMKKLFFPGFLADKTSITVKVSSSSFNTSLEGWDEIWNFPNRTLDNGIILYKGTPLVDRFASSLFSYESREHSLKWIQFDLHTPQSVIEVIMTLHHPW